MKYVDEDVQKSVSSFYPKVNLDLEYIKLNEYPVVVNGVEERTRDDRYDQTLNVEQLLYDRSKYLEYKKQKNNYTQTSLEKDKAYQQLVYDVIKYYFETLFRNKQIELTNQKLERLEKIELRAKLKSESGFISKADYLEAQAEKGDLLVKKAQLILDYNLSKSFLKRLTGLENIEIKKKIELKEVDIMKMQEYLNDINENLDVRIQKMKIKQADIQKSISVTGFEPSLSLNYEYKNNDIEGVDEERTLTLLLQVPIFSGFYDVNNYQQAKISQLIEKESMNQLIKDTKQSINNKYQKVKTYIEIIKSYPAIIQAKAFSLESMREKFNVGTKTIINLLDEENKYFDKLNKYTEYKYQYVVEYTSLKQYTNSLDEEFIKKVNGFISE
ncbi:TolC family protein [Sulfurimonas sp. CS5]|uniref:TolC family protein n=1 Tax=Sulfurimonas sp. CS5 TaxID=3391145 RepID=UPI0039EAA766